QSGISEAHLTARQAQIDFHPLWPALTEAELNLMLSGPRLFLEMIHGKLAEASISSLTGALDLSAQDPILAIQGQSSNSLEQILKVLALSPLRPAVEMLMTKTSLSGQADLSLAITVPTRHPGVRIDGKAKLQGADWQLLHLPLRLNDLTGELRFTEKQLAARLDGKFQRQPAILQAKVDRDRTELILSTHLETAFLPVGTWHQHFEGRTSVRARLEMEHARATPSRLEVQSDLKGLAIHLPYPAGKTEDLPRPLRLTAWLTSSPIPVHLSYGPMHAAFAFDPSNYRLSGQINLGEPIPTGEIGRKLILAGHIDRLPLDHWLAFWSKRQDPSSLFHLERIDLRIDQMQLGEHDLGFHHITAHRLPSGWEGKLTSLFATGHWAWRADPNQFNFEGEFFDLDKLKAALQTNDQTLSTQRSPALTWPALSVSLRHLRWHGQDLGAVSIKLSPKPPSGLGLDFSLSDKEHHLQAAGTWHRMPAFTQVSGRFISDDLGRFLKRIGHTTALIQTPTALDFRLEWPGGPQHFSIPRLSGQIRLDLGAGRWLDVEPGAGRLLGLLYLGTLGRRLRLDFSDLFQAGLSFERIGGHIHLKNGVAFTDDLIIAATSARIHITGTADLANHQVDEYVSVFPNTPMTLGLFKEHSTNGLGKVASLAQRLFNTPLDSITQSQYAIYGTWDDPNIVLVRRSLPGAVLHKIWSEFEALTGEK
ncbi:MAG: DUF3971 domain-containing protein, partial [Methylohalobius sp.]|nr:DUF3971 domain-containing protein [Methylohalobius sp.]